MRLLDTLSLSTRMFKTRPMRTFLTILGVSVGIGAVLFLVSLGYGLQNAILSKITTTDSLLSLNVTSGQEGLLKLTKEDADSILEINEVSEVSAVIDLSAQLTVADYTGDGLIRAVTPSFFRLSGTTVDHGKTFGEDSGQELIISTAGLQMLNIPTEEAMGKEVAILLFVQRDTDDGFGEIVAVKRDEKYKIVGIIENNNTNFSYIPIQTIDDLGITEYEQLQVKVLSESLINSVRDQIVERGFLVSSLSDTIDQAKKIFSIVQIVLALFGLVALIVSAIGMFNTMTIALLERINEIGIMRAIGMTKANIRSLFLLESVLMGFLGGLGGIGIGMLGGYLSNIGINLLAKTFGGQSASLFYSPGWFIAFIMIFSTIIGFLTGVYPSIKASRINPLDALRYK